MAADLRDLFHEIEAALEAGASQATVLEELHEMGLDINPSTFSSTMRRLRTRPRFADTGSGAGPSTTVRGSLYDVEALSRLLFASAQSRPAEDALGGWR